MEVSKKHILITGAAHRIGRFLVDDFLKHYAAVKISAHYHKTKPIPINDNKVSFFSADLTEKKQCEELFQKALKCHGPIDILIHTASIFKEQKWKDLSEEVVDENIALHLKSALWLAQAMVKTLNGKEGSIVHFLDVFSEKSLRDHLPYSVSKAALGMLTKSLAKECAPHIRVNSLSPGTILPQDKMSDEAKEKALKKNLFPFWPGPIAVAGGVRFLLENDYITGFNLVIDGGRSLN